MTQPRGLVCPSCRTWFEADPRRQRVRCPACGERVDVEANRLSVSELEEVASGEEATHSEAPDYVPENQPEEVVALEADKASVDELFGSLIFLGSGLYFLSLGTGSLTRLLLGLALMANAAWSAYETSGWRAYRHPPGSVQRFVAQIPGFLFKALRWAVVGLFLLLSCVPF